MSTINTSDLLSILARYGIDSPSDLKDLLPYLQNEGDTSIPQEVRDIVNVTTPDSTPGTLSDTELEQIQTALTALYSGPAPGASQSSTAFSTEVNFLMTGVGTTSAPYISSDATEVQSSMSVAGNDLQDLIDNPPEDWYEETTYTYKENGETITVTLKTIKADKLADYYNAVMSKLNRLLTLFTTTNALLQTRAKAAREWSEADLDDDLKQKLEEGRKDYEKNKRHLLDSVSNLQKKTLEGVQKMISKMFEMVQKANDAEITKALNDIDKKWRSTGEEHDNEKSGDYDVNRANLKEKVTAGAEEVAQANFQQMAIFNQRVTQLINLDAIGLGSASATSLKNTIETDMDQFRNADVTKDDGAIFHQTVGKDSGAGSFVDYDMDFMLQLRTKLNLYQNLVRTVVNARVAVLDALRQAAVVLQNARVSQETDSVIGNSIGAMEATFSKQTSALEMLHVSAMQYVNAFNTHKQAEIDLEKAKEAAKIKKNTQIITWVVTVAVVIAGALLCLVPGGAVIGVGLMLSAYSIGSAAGDVYKNSAMADMEKSFDQEFYNPETVAGLESQIKLEAAQSRLRTLEEKRKNGTLTAEEQNEYYIVNSEVALYQAEAEFRNLGSLIITGGDKMQAADSGRLAQANKRIAVQHNKIRLLYAIAKSIQEAKENALVMAFGIGKTGSMGKYQNQLESILSTEMSLFSDLENELQTRVSAHNQNTAKDKRIYDYTVNMIFAAVNLVMSFAGAFLGPVGAGAMGFVQGGLGMIQTSITNKWGPYAGAKASYKDEAQLKREHEAYNPGPQPDPATDPQAYLDWQERNIMYQMTDPNLIRDSGDGAFGEKYAEVNFAKIAALQKQMMVVQMQRMVITMLQASVMKAMQSAIKLAFGISSSGVALNDAMTIIDAHSQAQNASFGHMAMELQTRVDVHNRITAANIEWAIGMVAAGVQMLLSAASMGLARGAGKAASAGAKAAMTASKVLRALTPLLVTTARLAMRLSLYTNNSQNRYTTDIRSSVLDTAGDDETVDPSKTRPNPTTGSGQGSNLGLDESAIIATEHGSVTMDYSIAVQTQWRIEIQTRILELVKDIQMAFLESQQKALEYFSDIDTNSSYRSAMSMIRSASNAEKQITEYASKQLQNKVTSVNRRQDALRAAIKEAITAAIQLVVLAITAGVDKASKQTGAGSKPTDKTTGTKTGAGSKLTDKTTGTERQGSFKLDVAKLAVSLSEISTDLLATVIAVEVIDVNADNEYRKEGIRKDSQTLSEIENNTNTGKVSVGNKNTGSWENQLISAEITSANAQAVSDINMMARLQAQMLAQALINFENKMAETVITKGTDKAINSDAAKKLAFGKNIPFLSKLALGAIEGSIRLNDIKQTNPLDKGRDARVAQSMKQMEDTFNQKQQMKDLYKLAHSLSTEALSTKAVTSLNRKELNALAKSLEAAADTKQLSPELQKQITTLKNTVQAAQSKATYQTLTQMETEFKAIISSLVKLQSDAHAEITSATVALKKETAAMGSQSDRIRADSKQASEIQKAQIAALNAGAKAPPADLFSKVTQTFSLDSKGVVTEVADPYDANSDPADPSQSPRQVTESKIPLFLAASGTLSKALNQTELPTIMVLVSESDMADPVALQKTISEAVRSAGVPVEDMLFIPATDSKTTTIVAKPLLAAPHTQVDDAVQQISKATAELKEISSVLSSLQEAIPFLTEMTHHANAAKLAVLSNLVSKGDAAQTELTTTTPSQNTAKAATLRDRVKEGKAAKTELDALMETINSESGLGDLDAPLTSAKTTLANMADQLAKISRSVQGGTLTPEQSKSISTAQKSVAEVQKDVENLVKNLTSNHKTSIKRLIRNLIQPSKVDLTTGRGFTDMNWRLAINRNGSLNPANWKVGEDRAETTNNILKQLQTSPGTETPSEVAAHMFFEDIQGLIGGQLTHNEARSKGFDHTQRSLAFQSQLEKKDLDVAFSIAKLSTAVSVDMAADTMLVLMQRLDGARLKDHIPRLIQALATIDHGTAAEIVTKMTEQAMGPQKALLLSALTNASMGPLTSGVQTSQQRYKDSSSFAFERPFERAFKDSTYQKNAQKMMERIDISDLATSIRPEDMVESDFLATLSEGYSESDAAKEQTHAIMADILKQATTDTALKSKLTPKAIAAYETEKAAGTTLSQTSAAIDTLITNPTIDPPLKNKLGAMAIAFAFANKTGTLEMLKPFVTDLNAEVTTISASIQKMDRLATRPPSSLLTPSKTSDLLEAIKENIEALPRDLNGKLAPDSEKELRKALPAIAIAVAEKLKVPNGTPSAVGFIENLSKRVPDSMQAILMEALSEAITSSPEHKEMKTHLESFKAHIPSTRTLLTTMSAQVANGPKDPLSTIKAQTQMNGHMDSLIQRIHSAQPHEVLGLLRQNPGLSAAVAKGLEGSPKLTADLLLLIDRKTTGSTAIRAEFSRQIAADVQRLNRNTTTPPITAKSIQSNIPMGGSLAGDIIRDIQKASDLGAAQLFLDNTEGQAAKLAIHHRTNPSETLKLFNGIVLLNPIKASNIIIGLAAGTPQQAALVEVLLDAAGEQIKRHMPPEDLDQISSFLTAVEYQADSLGLTNIRYQIADILDFKYRLDPQTSSVDDIRLGASDFNSLSQESHNIINATSRDVGLSGDLATLQVFNTGQIKVKLAQLVKQIGLSDLNNILTSITGQNTLTDAKLTELDNYANSQEVQDIMSPAQKVQMSQLQALAHLLRDTGPDSSALASLVIKHSAQEQQLQFLSQAAALPGLTALISKMDNPAETAKTIETILTLANENRGNTHIQNLMNDPAFMAAVLQQTHQMVGHVAQSKTIASTPASAREALLLESNIQLLESLISTKSNAPLSEHIHLMSLQAKTGKPAKTNTDALHQAALTAIDKQIDDPAGNLSLMKASLSAMIHEGDTNQNVETLKTKSLSTLVGMLPDLETELDAQITAAAGTPLHAELTQQKATLMALKTLTRQVLTAARDMAGYQDAMLTALSTAASPTLTQALASMAQSLDIPEVKVKDLPVSDILDAMSPLTAEDIQGLEQLDPAIEGQKPLASDLKRLSDLVTSQKANRQLDTLFTQLQHSDTKVLDPTQLKEAHIEPLRKILESATLRTQLKAGNPQKYAQLMIVLAQFEANQPDIPPKTIQELAHALTDAKEAKTLADQNKATNVRDLQTAQDALDEINAQPQHNDPAVLAQLPAALASIHQLEASGPGLDAAVAAAQTAVETATAELQSCKEVLAIRDRIAALVPDSAEAELDIAGAILLAYTQFSKAITVDHHAAFVETFCDLNPKEQGEFLLAINSQFTHFSDLVTLPPVSQRLINTLQTLKRQLPTQYNFDRLADAGVVDKLQTLLTRFQENDVTHIQELQRTCEGLYTKASTGDPITQTLHQIGEKIRVIAPHLIDRGLFNADELEELLSQTGEPGHELLSLVTILTKATTQSTKLPKEWTQYPSPPEKSISSTLGEAKIALGKTLMHELITNPDINADRFKETPAAARLKDFFTMAAQKDPGSDPPVYSIARALDQALLKHSAVEKYQHYFAPADAAIGQRILEHTGRHKTLKGLKIAIEQLNGKTTPIVALINHIDDLGLRERVIGDLLDGNFTEGLHILSAVTTSDPGHMKRLQELVWEKTLDTNPDIEALALVRIFAAIQIGLGDTLFASSMQVFLDDKMAQEDPKFKEGFDAAIREIKSMAENSALPEVAGELAGERMPDRSVTYQKMRQISSMIQRLSATSPDAKTLQKNIAPFIGIINSFITSMVLRGAIPDIEYMLSQFAVTDRSTLSLILEKSPALAFEITAKLKELTPKTARQLLEYPAIFNAAITMPFTQLASLSEEETKMLSDATIIKPGNSENPTILNPNINSEQDLIRRLELTALTPDSRESVLTEWKAQINASDIPTLTARVAAFPELIASITDPEKLEALLIAFKSAGKLQEIKPFIATCTPTLQQLLQDRLLSDAPLAIFPTTELLNLLENPIQIADMMKALLTDPPVTSDQRKNFLTQVLSDPALFRATPHRQLLIQDMVTDLVRNHLDDMTALSLTDSLLPVVKASLHEALLIALSRTTPMDEDSVIVQLKLLGYLPANLREKLYAQGSKSEDFIEKLEDLEEAFLELHAQLRKSVIGPLRELALFNMPLLDDASENEFIAQLVNLGYLPANLREKLYAQGSKSEDFIAKLEDLKSSHPKLHMQLLRSVLDNYDKENLDRMPLTNPTEEDAFIDKLVHLGYLPTSLNKKMDTRLGTSLTFSRKLQALEDRHPDLYKQILPVINNEVDLPASQKDKTIIDSLVVNMGLKNPPAIQIYKQIQYLMKNQQQRQMFFNELQTVAQRVAANPVKMEAFLLGSGIPDADAKLMQFYFANTALFEAHLTAHEELALANIKQQLQSAIIQIPPRNIAGHEDLFIATLAPILKNMPTSAQTPAILRHIGACLGATTLDKYAHTLAEFDKIFTATDDKGLKSEVMYHVLMSTAKSIANPTESELTAIKEKLTQLQVLAEDDPKTHLLLLDITEILLKKHFDLFSVGGDSALHTWFQDYTKHLLTASQLIGLDTPAKKESTSAVLKLFNFATTDYTTKRKQRETEEIQAYLSAAVETGIKGATVGANMTPLIQAALQEPKEGAAFMQTVAAMINYRASNQKPIWHLYQELLGTKSSKGTLSDTEKASFITILCDYSSQQPQLLFQNYKPRRIEAGVSFNKARLMRYREDNYLMSYLIANDFHTQSSQIIEAMDYQKQGLPEHIRRQNKNNLITGLGSLGAEKLTALLLSSSSEAQDNIIDVISKDHTDDKSGNFIFFPERAKAHKKMIADLLAMSPSRHAEVERLKEVLIKLYIRSPQAFQATDPIMTAKMQGHGIALEKIKDAQTQISSIVSGTPIHLQGKKIAAVLDEKTIQPNDFFIALQSVNQNESPGILAQVTDTLTDAAAAKGVSIEAFLIGKFHPGEFEIDAFKELAERLDKDQLFPGHSLSAENLASLTILGEITNQNFEKKLAKPEVQQAITALFSDDKEKLDSIKVADFMRKKVITPPALTDATTLITRQFQLHRASTQKGGAFLDAMTELLKEPNRQWVSDYLIANQPLFDTLKANIKANTGITIRDSRDLLALDIAAPAAVTAEAQALFTNFNDSIHKDHHNLRTLIQELQAQFDPAHVQQPLP